MKKNLFIFFIGFVLFFLCACQSEEKDLVKEQNSTEELVQIEQNDEKTQISDSNLPLPIEDEVKENATDLGFNLSVVNSLYKKKCSSCHGKKAELEVNGNRAIKNLDKQSLIQRLNDLEQDKNKNHILELSQRQIENLAEFISKGNK